MPIVIENLDVVVSPPQTQAAQQAPAGSGNTTERDPLAELARAYAERDRKERLKTE